jgi:hypothetical protein
MKDTTVAQSGRRRRRRPLRANPIIGFLRLYPEVVLMVLFGLGVFLVVSRAGLRRDILVWVGRGFRGASEAFAGLAAAPGILASQLTLADKVGLLLVIGAGAAIAVRMRWRLMHTAALRDLHCPKCGGTIHRIHRKRTDRLLDLFVPVRRYGCSNADCRWRGLRIGHGGSPQSEPRPPVSAEG